MYITQEFDLNMIPDSSPVIVYADQYDVGYERLKINLYSGSQKFTPEKGSTVKIQGTKPDNKGFSYSAKLSGNVVTADVTEQMTAVAGRVWVNVVVTKGTERTGTFVFWLEVQATGLADDVDISETVLPEYIDGAQKAAEEAKKAAEEAKKAAEDIDVPLMTNSVIGKGKPDGTTAEASNGVFTALGVAIPAVVNPSGTEYGSDWLIGIAPDTRQLYRVTVNGNASLYYWTGTRYSQIAGSGGTSADLGVKVSGTVNGSTLTFMDSSITSDAVIDGPYIKDVLIGVKGVTENGKTLIFTLSDNLADGKSAYIWVRESSAAKLSSIVVTTNPTKTTYNQGDTLDLTGIVVMATYSDGSVKTVTDDCVFNPANGSTLSSAGSQSIAVSYTDSGVTAATSLSVTVQGSVEIVSWSQGTDAQIIAMIEAADRGEIDLTDYWNVEDERTIHLSAMERGEGLYDTHVEQDVVFVLTHSGDTELVTPTESGRKVCSFDVMMKGVLSNGNTSEYGVMNSTATNEGGWAETPRRTWANSIFYNAIPSSIRQIFKKFKCVSGVGKKSSQTVTTEDYFAYVSECNLYGDTAPSGETEGVRWDYFNNGPNVKNDIKYNNNGLGNAAPWFKRSAAYNSTSFCMETADGLASVSAANVNTGISLFGVI